MANINVVCPKCNTTLTVASEFAGQAVGCPSCGTNFTVPVQAAAPAAVMPTPMPAAAPMPQPMQQPGAMYNNRPVSGPPPRIRKSYRSASSGGGFLSFLALLVGIGSFVYSFFFVNGIPEIKFSKDPETACRNYLKSQLKMKSYFNYSAQKNYKTLLKNLSVDEVSTNGDYALAFYSIKKGASTYKDVMYLKKNGDGYYIEGWGEDAKPDEEWHIKMIDKIDKYKEGSVKRNTLFD